MRFVASQCAEKVMSNETKNVYELIEESSI